MEPTFCFNVSNKWKLICIKGFLGRAQRIETWDKKVKIGVESVMNTETIESVILTGTEGSILGKNIIVGPRVLEIHSSKFGLNWFDG